MRAARFMAGMITRPLKSAARTGLRELDNLMSSNQPISSVGGVKNVTAVWKKEFNAAKDTANRYIETRRNQIFDKRMANPEASEWATKMLASNGIKGKAASFLFNGETGNLSKKRIAGLAAAGYVATPDSNRR